MKIGQLADFFYQIAPLNLQEEYDNAGLITGHPETEIKGILIALDSTEDVILEAVKYGCNLVIAHHPIVFKGLKKINGHHYVERAIISAIKNDIAILALHTNLDNVYQHGVNQKIAEKLDLRDTEILLPKSGVSHAGQPVGAGMSGFLPMSMATTSFLNYVKSKLELKVLKHTHLCKNDIRKVAVCGGSGSFLIPKAIQSQADVYITSDLKYHEYFEADHNIILLDIGHFESEKYTNELLYGLIMNNFSNFAVRLTETVTNPVHYY